MDQGCIAYMYDCVWSGMCNDFKPFYEEQEPKMQPSQILSICRYAFRYYLKWTPEDVARYLTTDVLHRMKLYNLVMKLYPFPVELTENMRVEYLVKKLYPDGEKFDPLVSTEEAYRRMIEDGEDMPKGFFNASVEGRQRAKICLRYMLNHYRIFKDYQEIFDFFSTLEGRKWIAQYRLKQNVHFFGTMADYIFESLTEKPMVPSKYEECMYFRGRYKSMYYMERYERKKKKLLADQYKKQEDDEMSEKKEEGV